jgi:ribosomal protein S18 acetylase RimI-like enzyme
MSTIDLRPLRADDLPAVCALHNRSEAHDGVPRVLPLEELQEELDDVHIVFATDTRLALVDGQLAGYAYTTHLPSEVKEERCYVFGEVDPAFRRRGVGRALLEWGVDRGSQQLRSSGRALPRYLRVDSYDYIVGAQVLFERAGFVPVRWFEELLRPLTDLPPTIEIDGLRIVPWDHRRSDEIRNEKNTSFLDHWGSTPASPELWRQHVEGFGARHDLSFIALDDHDRVVAHCFNTRYPEDDALIGRRDGWIDSLGTLPEWRGRGVGSALIARSLHAFAADGLTHASIGVDSDNPSGAARLYRNLGFEPQQRSVTWQIVVD